ncbi:MAG: hypothetical protein EGR41_02315 [Ruminococcus sp.]|nr:hypothetical protein [Ruminococcus sp.]
MDTIILILIIITLIITVFLAIFVIYSLKSKSYLAYKKKLNDFENKKRKIEEDIENARNKFNHNS